MSNKARSRKMKSYKKLGKIIGNFVFSLIELRMKIIKEREKNYPKLEPGGTVQNETILSNKND